MRVFAALPVAPEVVGELERIIHILKKEYRGLKTVRPEGLHLTLQFFGELSEAQVARLAAAMDELGAAGLPISAGLNGCGQFPPRGTPRVIWCGIGPGAAEIIAFRERFCEVTERHGFPLEPKDRRFIPHLTLARNSTERVREGFVESIPVPASVFKLERLVLYQSVLSREGASYRVLKEVP